MSMPLRGKQLIRDFGIAEEKYAVSVRADLAKSLELIVTKDLQKLLLREGQISN